MVEMLCQIRTSRDLHLNGVEQTRRAAVCGKPWEILPSRRRGVETRPEVVDAVKDLLEQIPEWPGVIGSMQDAVTQPLSAIENLWTFSEGQLWIEHLLWAHPKLFSWNTTYTDTTVAGEDGPIRLGELRLWTEKEQTLGVRLRRDQWMIHQTDGPGDYPWNRGMGSIIWYEGFKQFSWRNWVTWLDRCAIPIPVISLDSTQPAEAAQAIADQMAADMGDGRPMVLRGADTIAFQGTNSTGDASYQRLIDAVNLELSKAYLGHSGSSDSTPGALGGQDLAGEIRQDLVESDARGIEASIYHGVIEPFVRLNYGPLEPPPRIHLQVDAQVSRRELMDLAVKGRSIGLPIDRDWLATSCGLQLTTDPAKMLPALGAQGVAPVVAGTAAPQGVTP